MRSLFVCSESSLPTHQKKNDGPPHSKDMGGSQHDNDSSPNLSFNDLKQKEIEIKEGSTRGKFSGGLESFQVAWKVSMVAWKSF